MGASDRLVDKRWAILDVEFIATSSSHRCIRKLYILAENGFTDMEMEFYPCNRYRELESKYKQANCLEDLRLKKMKMKKRKWPKTTWII